MLIVTMVLAHRFVSHAVARISSTRKARRLDRRDQGSSSSTGVSTVSPLSTVTSTYMGPVYAWLAIRVYSRGGTSVISNVPSSPVTASYGEIGRASCRERVCQYV